MYIRTELCDNTSLASGGAGLNESVLGFVIFLQFAKCCFM